MRVQNNWKSRLGTCYSERHRRGKLCVTQMDPKRDRQRCSFSLYNIVHFTKQPHVQQLPCSN
uniref:Uncharacterized protein n=1 Tax=Anguilla anguilla TaxID=7936 RepID=A0A0E9WFP3_ANGAN